MSLGDRVSDVLEMERRDQKSGGRALEIGERPFKIFEMASVELELGVAGGEAFE
jgi:hypothetical protein